ncbi:MAG: phytase [Hyphomicrobium sp.]|nr:phytase [Hyphomicrobium sp.]
MLFIGMRASLALMACIALGQAGALASEIKLFDVEPGVETEPAKSMEDAADDAEVWLNPAAADKSLIFGTDKKSGLFVFGLDGAKVDFFPVGRVNNVDLRSGFETAAGARVLVGASNRTKLGISLFLLDPATLRVVHDEGLFIATDLADPYGFCMYSSGKTGALFAIVIGKDGEFRQFALTPSDQGIKAELVRKFAFGSIAEGCVADDRTGILYVGDELRGIWRLGAEPDAGEQRELIAEVDGKELVADIEGLTLAPDGKDGGFLIASVQGNSTYALFSLPDSKLVARFRIVANAEKNIDEVTGTDGIALTVGNFGDQYPSGLLVVQDDENPGAAQNFKYVSWADILNKLNGTN